MLRPASAAALCLASFLATALVIAELAPQPTPPGVAEKLRAFARDKDAYELVFVGSSHVYRSIDPQTFDAEMSEAGHPLRSFNLGMPGMRPHEANAVLRTVLAMQPARLRWVVVEIGDWMPQIEPANRLKQRPLFWHDRLETRSVLRSSLLADEPWSRRLDLLLAHLQHFAVRSLAIGRGPELVKRLLGAGDPPGAVDPAIEAGRGFFPYRRVHYESGETARLRKLYLDRYAEYQLAVRTLHHDNRAETGEPTYNIRALEDQVAAIRAAGAEPVYLIFPSLRPTPELLRLGREGRIPSLLAFNDPESYPQLYRDDQRFDLVHLNEHGARELSRLVARQLAARWAGE